MAADTPTIRYRALTDLLHLSQEDEQVTALRQAIMQEGPVPAILARQTETGQWAGEQSYYTPKYVSTHWSLMLLTELAVDGRDPRFQQGVDYMLETTAESLKDRLETDRMGFSCFWGNALRYAHRAGKLEDPRVAQIIHYASRDINEGHCRCEHNWHFACAWGVVRTLWGLAAIPKKQRSPAVNRAIETGITFLLDTFQLIEANYPTSDQGKVHPLWFKLNFPLFYQVDILFTLRILAELEVLDHPGAQPALDWLEGRRGRNGRWRGSSPYRGRTWSELGDRSETDRWVSWQAAAILKQAGRLTIP
jgi:hypothetical protein